MAVDPGTHTVYVTNRNDDTVSVIDGSTHTVTATVPVGKSPDGVAVDPGTHTVYVTNQLSDGTVSVIDGSTRTVTATVPVGNAPERGGGGSGHPHRLRHQPQRQHGVGDRISIVFCIGVWARRLGCRSYISGSVPTLPSQRSLSINHCRASQSGASAALARYWHNWHNGHRNDERHPGQHSRVAFAVPPRGRTGGGRI